MVVEGQKPHLAPTSGPLILQGAGQKIKMKEFAQAPMGVVHRFSKNGRNRLLPCMAPVRRDLSFRARATL
jgi:hypothetical protein